MAWGTFLFIVMLHGKFVNVADSLAQLVCILTDFRVNKFGIYLGGKNGIIRHGTMSNDS